MSDFLGWNTLQRRNLGLLYAYEVGAEIIAVVDDDNIPYEWWGKNISIGKPTKVRHFFVDDPAFDPVGATDYPYLWHRGFPLELLPKRNYSNMRHATIVPDVQADFWNGNPDIDAVCRLEHAPECKFKDEYFPIASNKMSPFNSQNTFLSRRVLKDYFLCPDMGRMDDIWAAYYVQALGAKVIYGKASVYQKRNVHNLIDDMKLEYIGYENNMNLIHDLRVDSNNYFKYISPRAKAAFERYRTHYV